MSWGYVDDQAPDLAGADGFEVLADGPNVPRPLERDSGVQDLPELECELLQGAESQGLSDLLPAGESQGLVLAQGRFVSEHGADQVLGSPVVAAILMEPGHQAVGVQVENIEVAVCSRLGVESPGPNSGRGVRVVLEAPRVDSENGVDHLSHGARRPFLRGPR